MPVEMTTMMAENLRTRLSAEDPHAQLRSPGPALTAVPKRKYAVGSYPARPFGPDVLTPPRNTVDEDLDPVMPPDLVRSEARVPRANGQKRRAPTGMPRIGTFRFIASRRRGHNWKGTKRTGTS
jgi:hypothetical protein